MKILHLIGGSALYGAERVVLQLMVEQKENGIIPILGSIGDHSDEEKDIEREAVNNDLLIKKIRMKRGPNIIGAFKILKFALEEKIDIIHCHGYKANILMGLIPTLFKKVPHIFTIHGWSTSKKLTRMWFYEWMDAYMAKRAAKTIVVSNAMLRHPKIKRIALNPVCIHNGIKICISKEDLIPEINDMSPFKESFLIGSVGRLAEVKGIDILIKAFSEVYKSNRDISLIIFGEGPERKKLEELTSILNIENSVFFFGYRHNAYKYFKKFDLFVNSSFSEGLPMTLLEAMYSEVPIIATNVGGIPEVLSKGKFGILVPPGDIDALADAIASVYDDKKLRQKISVGSKDFVIKEFSSQTMERQYRSIYESLLDK